MILFVPRRVVFWINSILVVADISFRYCSSLPVTFPSVPTAIGMILVDTFQSFPISVDRFSSSFIFSCYVLVFIDLFLLFVPYIFVNWFDCICYNYDNYHYYYFENHEHFYMMHVLHILPTEQGLDRPCFNGTLSYFFT